MMQLHILLGFQTTLRALLTPSVVWRTIIQYKALSRLQQAEVSPHQPLIQPPLLLTRLQCAVGLDNQIPDAISTLSEAMA